ncbi:MAG: class I SAM-dependent rRNA methyltransferase [Eubacteriales bacterium]|nr:class I SAM-dependent rRNA methyltransferase [Eubacteriales bacterium]
MTKSSATPLPTVVVKNGMHKAIAQGHPWVYRTQIETIRDLPDAGEINKQGDPDGMAATAASAATATMVAQPARALVVDVVDFRGRSLGRGLYNSASMIAVRILATTSETVDEHLIRERLTAAIALRQRFARPDTDSYRLVFAEADRLPGLIVDQFATTLVVQVLSMGMETFLHTITETLLALVKPDRLILQHEEAIRVKEGLPLYRKIVFGDDCDRTVITENGLKLVVDLANGQKTGYFLDQKANHAFLRQFSAGQRVLDCFTYIGGFALNALAGGAREVTAVDVSAAAIELTRENARLNGLEDRLQTVTANAFDFLRDEVRAGHHYDVIVLDPPAFAKSHAAKAAAIRGYKEINLSALRLLESGGILATHSCSYHMSESIFLETILEAARDAKKRVRILDIRRQDFDHPVLGGYPESHYLKSIWLQIV